MYLCFVSKRTGARFWYLRSTEMHDGDPRLSIKLLQPTVTQPSLEFLLSCANRTPTRGYNIWLGTAVMPFPFALSYPNPGERSAFLKFGGFFEGGSVDRISFTSRQHRFASRLTFRQPNIARVSSNFGSWLSAK